jgi:dolichyl-phosphate-mannose-protein mannosyltransferase
MKEIHRTEGQIVNGSFEQADEGWPLGWSMRGGSDWTPKFEYAKTGHTGSRSIRISAQPYRSGAWIFMAKVKRNTSYKLSGWIRTENLIGGARANLGVLEFFGKGNQPCFTEGFGGTQGWTRVSVTLPSGENDWIEITCQLTDAGDAAAGDAWFDDIELEENPNGARDGA